MNPNFYSNTSNQNMITGTTIITDFINFSGIKKKILYLKRKYNKIID